MKIKNTNYIRIILIGTLIAIPILATLYMRVSLAAGTNDIINQQTLNRDIAVKEIAEQHRNFENYKKISKQNISTHQAVVQNIKSEYLKTAQAKGFIKKAPEAEIFISFSMPTPSLKQIIQDAARCQIPVVIRGLYKNSFKETIEKIFELVKEDNKGGVLINPLWFKTYDIKVVPALVINSNEINIKNKEHSEFDVIYGNIPLKRLLEIIANQGTVTPAKAAQNILSRSRA